MNAPGATALLLPPATEPDAPPASARLYRPRLVRVRERREETPAGPAAGSVATLSLERGDLVWQPGQFLQAGVFGAGEVPISISSPPLLDDTLLLTVRAAGGVSAALNALPPGATLGIRGPFGNAFPLDEWKGLDVLFVAGGIGLAPLRSVLWQMLLDREAYGRITVLHGARSPRDLLYAWQYESWRDRGVDVFLSVDIGDGVWERRHDSPRVVGVVTTLLPRVALDPANTVAIVCGPPILIRVGCQDVTTRYHIPAERCFATLERHMKCGLGKCGHCLIADRYVCVDGPVFRYDEMLRLARIEPPW